MQLRGTGDLLGTRQHGAGTLKSGEPYYRYESPCAHAGFSSSLKNRGAGI